MNVDGLPYLELGLSFVVFLNPKVEKVAIVSEMQIRFLDSDDLAFVVSRCVSLSQIQLLILLLLVGRADDFGLLTECCIEVVEHLHLFFKLILRMQILPALLNNFLNRFVTIWLRLKWF